MGHDAFTGPLAAPGSGARATATPVARFLPVTTAAEAAPRRSAGRSS